MAKAGKISIADLKKSMNKSMGIEAAHDLRKENARLRQNNEYYKLEYIEIKKKLFKVQELINK